MAIRHAQALGVSKVAVVTAAETPELGSLLRKQDMVISYARTDRERGFVSITGTVAPCALWAAAVCGTGAVAYLDQSMEMPWRDPKILASLRGALEANQAIDAIGTGFAAAALLDFESKLMEGNLGRVVLHESKDFSHGRFSLIFEEDASRTFVLFRTKSSSRYEEKLVKTLRMFGQVVDFESSQPDLLGGLELLVGAQFLAVGLGDSMGKDISCPSNISKSGLQLYRWRSLP
jgi:fructoselysine-6-P-deglycase FrlB-like protein